jgi:hypothetical protein
MSKATEIQKQLCLSPCDQVGFVFRDIDAAVRTYEPVFGSFDRMDPGVMSFNYRGKQEDCELRIAFAKSGDLEIELIGWVSGECPHKEFVDAGREGMMHLRFLVDNLDQKIEEAANFGYHSIWDKRFAENLAVSYMERDNDPLLIEFFENNA